MIIVEPARIILLLRGIKKRKREKMSKHGFTALPRDINILLKGGKNIRDPEPVMVDQMVPPETPLAKRVQEYAKEELREETYNQCVPPLDFRRGINC